MLSNFSSRDWKKYLHFFPFITNNIILIIKKIVYFQKMERLNMRSLILVKWMFQKLLKKKQSLHFCIKSFKTSGFDGYILHWDRFIT